MHDLMRFESLERVWYTWRGGMNFVIASRSSCGMVTIVGLSLGVFGVVMVVVVEIVATWRTGKGSIARESSKFKVPQTLGCVIQTST